MFTIKRRDQHLNTMKILENLKTIRKKILIFHDYYYLYFVEEKHGKVEIRQKDMPQINE